MGVFKGLFLGVYASSNSIRVLFLPLCYLLLASPFLLVVGRYFQIDSKISSALSTERSNTDILLQLFVGLVAFCLPTRILSGRNWDRDHNEGKRRVQQMPYWIPSLRHWGNVVFFLEGFLKAVRYTEPEMIETRWY